MLAGGIERHHAFVCHRCAFDHGGLMKRIITLIGAFLWASVLWSAQVTLSPAQYAQGGYSTITWSGAAPCVKSSNPAYSVWDTDTTDNGGRSVAPEVSTLFTITAGNP
jgi:hypothetical protein